MRLGSFLLVCLLCLGACGESVDSDKATAELLVARGKRALSESQFQAASATFVRAKQYDPANEQARFGHALAELLTFYEQVSLVVRAAGFGDLVPKNAGARPGDGQSDEADMYNRLILQLLLPMRDALAAAANELDTVGGADFKFTIANLPVQWNTDTILNLQGTWREGDVRLLGAIAHAFAGTLDLVAAHELKLDLFDALDYLAYYSGGFSSLEALTIPRLLNIVVHILEANPEFLELLARDADGDGANDGATLLPRVRAHLQKAALDLAGMRSRAERNPGILRAVAGQQGALATLTWNDALVVGYDASGEPVYGTISLPVTEGFEQGLIALAENLDGAAEPVRWKAHLVPVMAVTAVFAAGIINQLDFDLGDTIESALGLLTSPTAVEGLILAVIPDVLALDFGSYFSAPVGVRKFLPRWKTDGAPEERSFLLEWECGMPRYSGSDYGTLGAFLWYAEGSAAPAYHLTCPDKSAIDGAHFPGDVSAPGAAIYAELNISAPVAADGLASGLPYIAFGDPAFGGLLLLASDDSGTAAGKNPIGRGSLAPAGLRGLNALIAQVYTELGF